MTKQLTIREVQELIKGKTAKEAGVILSTGHSGNWCGLWYDWFCSNKALAGRASKFVAFIRGLEGDFIDTHCIWFKNNCPMTGSLYDDIRISPINTNVHYNVGYSLGNGDTRQSEVWDTRKEDDDFTVKAGIENTKEAIALVNELFNGGNRW